MMITIVQKHFHDHMIASEVVLFTTSTLCAVHDDEIMTKTIHFE